MPSIIGKTTSRYTDGTKFSNNLLVYIKAKVDSNKDNDVTVIARLPEEIQMQLRSEWDSPFLQSGSSSGIVELIGQVVGGVSTKTQFASAQIWSGASPIELTIPLEFYAEEDPVAEVIQPIVSLARMALPGQSGKGGDKGLFTPPGPRIFSKFGKLTGSTDITISMGNFMNFSKVIITEVNPTFVTKDMHISGTPLRATCEVTFRSMFTLTGGDFQANFPALNKTEG